MPNSRRSVQSLTSEAGNTHETPTDFQYIADCPPSNFLKHGDDPPLECKYCEGIGGARCADESICPNRAMKYECPDACGHTAPCANQRFRRQTYASTIVREAGRKGRGLYAKADIQKDSFIIEYVGEVIPLAKVSHRKAKYKAEGQSHLYFLTLNSESHRDGPPRCVIDATKKGNNSRFINHSCKPNCYVEGWHVGESVRMGIFANQFIPEGEELTFDYNFNNSRDDSNQRACFCGAPSCRGSLGRGGKEARLELKRTRSKPKVLRSTSVRGPAKSTPLDLTPIPSAGVNSFNKVQSPGPSIRQNARTFARLACPFFRRYPHVYLSKTCSHGSPDFRHVKEHLKNHHKCVCSRSGRSAACRNQLHLTPGQRTSIINSRRRRQDEGPSDQWIRIFQQMFPGTATVPAPYLMPSTEHLLADRTGQAGDISDAQDAIDKIAEVLPEGGNQVKRYSTNEGDMDDAKVKRPDSSHEIWASRDKDKFQSRGFDETEVSALFELLMEKGMLDKLVSKFGYQKVNGHEDEVKGTQLRPTAKTKEVPVRDGAKDTKCKECSKSFRRACELRKHMKRHQKPYACTHVPDCDKRFGSKSDWKRHENDQHIQLQFWRCAERVKDKDRANVKVLCDKICHRRETFRHHLDKDHGINDTATVEKRCTDCRIGRNFESHFWCGFCQKTIESTKNRGLVLSERFDHIDGHFTGKSGPKCDILDWKSMELEPLQDITDQSTRYARPRDYSLGHYE